MLQLTTKDVSRYNDLAAQSKALKQLGVQHGDLVRIDSATLLLKLPHSSV